MREGAVIGQWQQDRVNSWMRCRSAGNGSPSPGSKNTSAVCDVQRLWNLAQTIFGTVRRAPSTVPPPTQQIEVLRDAFAAISLQELGIQKDAEDMEARSGSCSKGKIMYLHIKEDKNLSLGIFCLPKGATIPLHDHPGMTVLSRVLYGNMHVKSFDWIDEETNEAVQVLNCNVTASDAPLVLFPKSGGNIHSFTAITPCAVLDLLAPPYLPHEGRDCTYFREVEYSSNGAATNVLQNREFRTRLEVYQPDFDIGTWIIFVGHSCVC